MHRPVSFFMLSLKSLARKLSAPRRTRRRRVQPVVETLEARQLLTGVTWQVQSDYFGATSTVSQPRSLDGLALSPSGNDIYGGFIQNPNTASATIREVSTTIQSGVIGNEVNTVPGTTAQTTGEDGFYQVGDQAKGVAVDNRGYVYATLSNGQNTTTQYWGIYNSTLTSQVVQEVSTDYIAARTLPGIATAELNGHYYVYIGWQNGQIERWNVDNPADPVLDTSWGSIAHPGTIDLKSINNNFYLDSMAVDSQGNIYIAGGILSTTSYGDSVIEVPASVAANNSATAGNTLQASVKGGADGNGGYSAMGLALYGGNVYVTEELGTDSAIAVFYQSNLGSAGVLTLPNPTGPSGFNANFPLGAGTGFSGITISPTGQVYVSEQIYADTSSSYSPNGSTPAITGNLIEFDRILVSTPLPLPTISVQSGNNQSTPINTQFADDLAVQVTDNGVAEVSQPVTFTAPASGASGTFSNSTGTITVLTDSNGDAMVPYTANGLAGSDDVTVTVAGATTPATFDLTNAQGTPAVTVTDAGGPYTGSPYTASTSSIEGVTPALTYYSGTAASGSSSTTAPSTVGTYTVLASFAGSTDYTSGEASTTFSITQGMPAVIVTDAGGIYDGSQFPAQAPAIETVAPVLAYYSGSDTSGTPLGATAPSTAGTYTVLASFAGSTDYTSGAASTTFTISQAAPTVTVTDSGGTFNGNAFSATDSVAGVGSDSTPGSSLEGVGLSLTYYSGTMASGSALGAAPSMAGTYSAVASFAGSTDYASGAASTMFTISQATPTVSVTDAGGGFNGSPYPAAATVNNAASLECVTPTVTYYSGTAATGSALGAVPSASGTYTAVANFAGSTDYTSASASVTFNITVTTVTTPTVVVTDASGPYNGSPFAATDTVNGQPSLEGVTPALTYYSGTRASGSPLGGAPSALGTYTVMASFAGSPDYYSASGSTTFSIIKGTPAVTVSDGGPYTSYSQPATARVNGTASLEGVTPVLHYFTGTSTTGNNWTTTAPYLAGTYSVLATFAGSTDYNTAAGSATFTIAKAAPTVTVSDAGGVYSGSTFPATDKVAGVGSQSAAASTLEGSGLTLSYFSGTSASGTLLSGAPSAIGTYTALASFAGSGDYTSAAASITFSIQGKTAPTVTVSDGGPYTSYGEPATALVNGSSSLDGVTPVLHYYSGTSTSGNNWTSTAPTLVGTYSVVASFAGSTNYSSATASATFSITKASPAVSVTDAGGLYTGAAFPATAKVAGVGSQSTAGSNLEGTTPTLAYYSGASATGSPLGGAPSAAGTYTVVATFAGSADYAAGSASTTFTITTKTVPTVTVSDGGTYSSYNQPATALVNGLSSLEGVTPAVHYYTGTSTTGNNWTTTAPYLAGTYSVLASFSGSTDYASAAGSATFTITPATPTVTVSDAGGTANGTQQFPATATVAGVGSQSTPGSYLDGVPVRVTYYSGTSATGTALTGAPSAAGTYTALASFVGSADYTSATNSVTFQIVADPYLAITAGNNQSAVVGSAFAQQLAVTVTNAQGQPLSGALVTFTVPASGAGGTFAGGATTVVVAADVNGVAVAPLLIAGGSAGSFTVTASTPGEHDGVPATFTLTNVLGD